MLTAVVTRPCSARLNKPDEELKFMHAYATCSVLAPDASCKGQRTPAVSQASCKDKVVRLLTKFIAVMPDRHRLLS